MIRDANLDDFGGIALFKETWRHSAIIGANPNDADHLLAVGATDGFIYLSTDGGSSWSLDMETTQAVINDGRFYAILNRYGLPMTQAISIHFDPNEPGHILIGTRQNGIIRSRDNGESWQQIPGSSKIPNVTNFHFSNDRTVIVASYGRGLWKLDFGFETPLVNVDQEELEMLEETPYIPIPDAVRINPQGGLIMVMRALRDNLSVLPDEEVNLMIWGIRPKESFGAVSLLVNGQIVNQDLLVDQDGKARATFQAAGVPGEHLTVRIEQGHGENLQWDERQLLIVQPQVEDQENDEQ